MRIFKVNVLAVIALTLLVSTLVFAQSEGGKVRGSGMGPRQGKGVSIPVISALDTDKDQTISSAEIAKASDALKTLDTDADGKLIADELMPTLPERKDDDKPEGNEGGRKRPERNMGNFIFRMPIMAALDTDKDQIISAEEIAKASDALKTLDKNQDGKLTQEELRPQRRQGGRKDKPQDSDK